MNENEKIEIQSATFNRLIKHLDERKDVQNIDLMNLVGFCRNCLSRWYREEAQKKGVSISDPEAIDEIADKQIPGFGEVFRNISLKTVGTSAIQSRACAVLANGKYVFALPGSSGGVTDAWEGILKHQLDVNHKPCNFVELFPRLKEK